MADQISGKDLADVVMQNVNIMNNKEFWKEFRERIIRNHPTLQQSFGREILIPMIKEFAKMYVEDHCDLRNEQLCRMCHALEGHINKEFDGGGLPFI